MAHHSYCTIKASLGDRSRWIVTKFLEENDEPFDSESFSAYSADFNSAIYSAELCEYAELTD